MYFCHVQNRLTQNGYGQGEGYAVNFPLNDGVDDFMFNNQIFQPVVRQCVFVS